MLVHVIRLRDHGWLLPRYQIAFAPRTKANLLLAEVRDDLLGRTSRQAKLLAIDTGKPLLEVPPLYDAQLVGVTRSVMTLSGIERLPDKVGTREMDFAQTWLVTPLADPDIVD